MREGKILRGGGGAFKAPPPGSQRVNNISHIETVRNTVTSFYIHFLVNQMQRNMKVPQIVSID